mgnify:CR=1 FL=1
MDTANYKVKVGYLYAIQDLERFICNHGPKTKKLRDHLYDCLDDMKYCIEQTQRAEKYDEVEKLKEELQTTRPK